MRVDVPCLRYFSNNLSAGALYALTLLCFALLMGTPASQAQSPALSGALQPMLEQAKADGSTIIVISPNQAKQGSEAPEQAAMPAEPGLDAFAAEMRRILARAPEFPASAMQAVAAAHPQGSTRWIWYAIGLALVAMLIGAFFGNRVDAWGRKHFKYLYKAEPEKRSEKLSYALMRAILMSAMVGVFLAISTLLVYLGAGSDQVVHLTAMTIVVTVTIIRIARIVFLNLLMPDAPKHRVLHFSDATAKQMSNRLTQVFIISGSFLALCTWMDRLNIDRDAHKLLLMSSSLLGAILLCGIMIRYRAEISAALLGPQGSYSSGVARLIASVWHIVAVTYFLTAWAITSFRLILDLPSALGLVGGPIAVLVLGLALYGLALFIIDKMFEANSAGANAVLSAGEEGSVATGAKARNGSSARSQAPDSPYKALFEHAVGLLLLAAAATALLQLWGADLFDEYSPFVRLLDIAIIVFIAYVAYQSVEVWVACKRAEEGDIDAADGLPGDDPGGAGSSRLVTLLPIFRNFLLITIVVIAGMIVLSELGVDIAPLFAGAGVVGLAIGFGAQTLIRDIFSGAFFLIDDAFRKGEYIDIGTAKGTVEKISIRSFQLRHHRGALNTIPFGEIKQLTNFSRDWVMMKLPIRLTYDTDIEKVRKLVKKLGQELLDDPDIGGLFLQPLKSQGVKEMEDSAMILRLKFMTRPGDQFQVRTKVYTRVRELFAKEGIKFAHREVTVRVNSTGEHLSEAEREAVAGAVVPTLDAPAMATPAADRA